MPRGEWSWFVRSSGRCLTVRLRRLGDGSRRGQVVVFHDGVPVTEFAERFGVTGQSVHGWLCRSAGRGSERPLRSDYLALLCSGSQHH